MTAVALAATVLLGHAETNTVTQLPRVIVYASRTEESVAEMPAPVRVYETLEIERSGARNLPEFLDRSAGLHVRRMNANPLQVHVAMRGFGEMSFGRVKIVVDGEEVNSVDLEAPNLARIPLGSIKRIEVIGGPSPVLYGDGAVAGVINITTDTHDYAKRTRVKVNGGSFGTFGANVATRGGFEDEGLLYSGSYDYTRSDGYRERSAYDLHAINGALRKNFANGSTLGVKANYSHARYEMPGSLTRVQLDRDHRQSLKNDDDCVLWNYGFALDAKARLADDQWLYVDGAFSVKHRETHWGQSTYSKAYENEYDLYSYQLAPRYVNEKAIARFDNKFTVGLDFRYDRYDVSDQSGWNNPDYNFERARGAFFAEETLFITETLSIVIGARSEYIGNRWDRYKGLKDTSSRDILGDYELALVYRPIADLKTYVKGTRFHRSAFCDELNYTADGTFLKPETGTSLDLGVDYTFLEEFTFDFAAYWSVMEDEIFYNPYAKYGSGSWGGYNCNSPDATGRIGFDTGFSWLREKTAEASLRYSFVKTRFRGGQYENNEIPLVPMSRVRAEVGVWIIDDLEVKGGYSYVAPQYLAGDFNNAHERLDGYSVFDVGVHYAPSWAEGWKASFVMENLFNCDFCDFAGWSDSSGAYYYPACGRSFQFTLSYEF